MKIVYAAAALAAFSATPALAQDVQGEDKVAFDEMVAQDYDAAEKKLLKSARTDVGARINLAQIFAKTDREREALILLRSVKANDDIALVGEKGDVLSSHRVADTLLARMGATEALAANKR